MMKNSNYILLLISFLFISCEKVIDVNLETAAPRLVIEASINWKFGTNGTEQDIKLSTTTDYFSNTIPPVTDAVVFITNSSNQQFDFVQGTEPGTYKCLNFNPVLNERYTLTVFYKNEIYTSSEKLLNTPTVKRVEQKNDGGFSGDEIEVKFVFDDIVNETNQYLVKIKDPNKVLPDYGVLEDRFFQNNEMFGLYFSADLKAGDILIFTNHGITLNYFNYMNILLNQTGSSNGGPFATPTSTIRGNIVNQTDAKNYPLGYFRLSRTEVREYTVQ